jgi:cytochrome P450
VAGRHQSCDAAGRPEVDARRAWQVGPAVVECCAWLAGLAAERRASRWPHAAPSRQGQQSSGRALLLEGCRRADRSNKEIRATIIFFLLETNESDLRGSFGWSTAHLGDASRREGMGGCPEPGITDYKWFAFLNI